jgi:hypothetical protein
LEKDNRRGNNRDGERPGERLRHWQTRGKDGEASQEPYVPFGTKGTKSSQTVYAILIALV